MLLIIMASYYKSISLLLSLIICLVSLVQSINNGGVTIDLIHHDSPRSPFYDPSITRFERLRNAFDHSFSRKSALSLASSKSVDAATEAPLSANGGGYLMEYQIGTPPVRQLSIADTGSDLTWIQCKPCTSCYKQDYPLFDPTATTSYRPLSCPTEQCQGAGVSTSCGDNSKCRYQVGYGDQSYSLGELAAETLTLGKNASFPKFVFGCGRNNAGTFKDSGSGIFGLGNGPVSVINQKASFISGRFSYCLTPLDSKVSSKISFGSDAVVAGPNVLSTPIVSKSRATFYYLTLKGLSVGTERFEYNIVMQQLAQGDEGNIIIDSGTTLTFVPAELYQGLEASLAKAIKGTRVEDPQGTFGLCYQLSSGGDLTSPPITAHFEGADVMLPQASTFLEVEEGVACLTLVPSQDLAIFGNLHQVGYLIGYDLVNKQVNFLQTDCTNPR